MSLRQKCPKPPEPSTDQLVSNAAQALEAMKLQSCSTSHEMSKEDSSWGFALAIVTPIGGGAGGGGGSSSSYSEKDSVVGCEDVKAISEQYYNTTQNISCILNQTQTTSSDTITGINSIIFTSGRDLKINCPSFKIDQSIKIKLIKVSAITEAQMSAIAEETKEFAESAADKLIGKTASSSNKLKDTPDGSKYSEELIQKIQNTDFKNQTREVLNSITTRVTARNEIVLEAGGDIILTGSQCEFNQNVVVDVMSQTLINTALTSVFGDIAALINEKKEEIKETRLIEEEKMSDIEKWYKELSKNQKIGLFSGISLCLLITILIIVYITMK